MTRPSRDHITSEDGTLLEVKEGVVLDETGQPLSTASEDGPHRSRTRVHVWRMGGAWGPLAALILPVLVIFGFLSLGTLLAILLAGFVLLTFIQFLWESVRRVFGSQKT